MWVAQRFNLSKVKITTHSPLQNNINDFCFELRAHAKIYHRAFGEFIILCHLPNSMCHEWGKWEIYSVIFIMCRTNYKLHSIKVWHALEIKSVALTSHMQINFCKIKYVATNRFVLNLIADMQEELHNTPHCCNSKPAHFTLKHEHNLHFFFVPRNLVTQQAGVGAEFRRRWDGFPYFSSFLWRESTRGA